MPRPEFEPMTSWFLGECFNHYATTLIESRTAIYIYVLLYVSDRLLHNFLPICNLGDFILLKYFISTKIINYKLVIKLNAVYDMQLLMMHIMSSSNFCPFRM